MCPNPMGWVFSTCYSYLLEREEIKRSFAGLGLWPMARSILPSFTEQRPFPLGSTENRSKI